MMMMMVMMMMMMRLKGEQILYRQIVSVALSFRFSYISLTG